MDKNYKISCQEIMKIPCIKMVVCSKAYNSSKIYFIVNSKQNLMPQFICLISTKKQLEWMKSVRGVIWKQKSMSSYQKRKITLVNLADYNLLPHTVD